MWKVTKPYQRKFDSLFAMMLNLYCLRLSSSEWVFGHRQGSLCLSAPSCPWLPDVELEAERFALPSKPPRGPKLSSWGLCRPPSQNFLQS